MIVKTTSNNIPIVKPAWRNAYGCPKNDSSACQPNRHPPEQQNTNNPRPDYTIRHIHKRTTHPTLRPRTLQMIFRIKLQRRSDARSLHIRKQRCSLPRTTPPRFQIIFVFSPFFIILPSRAQRMAIRPSFSFFFNIKPYSIRCTRCSRGSVWMRLRDGGLPSGNMFGFYGAILRAFIGGEQRVLILLAGRVWI